MAQASSGPSTSNEAYFSSNNTSFLNLALNPSISGSNSQLGYYTYPIQFAVGAPQTFVGIRTNAYPLNFVNNASFSQLDFDTIGPLGPNYTFTIVYPANFTTTQLTVKVDQIPLKSVKITSNRYILFCFVLNTIWSAPDHAHVFITKRLFQLPTKSNSESIDCCDRRGRSNSDIRHGIHRLLRSETEPGNTVSPGIHEQLLKRQVVAISLVNWSIRKDFRGNQRFGFSRRLFTVAILLFLVFAFSNPFFSSITFSRSSPVLRVSADSTPIWPTFQHDSQRSSLSSFLGPTFNTTDWVFGPTGAITNSPVIGADGTVYVVDSNSTLFAINPDGSLKWEKTLTENLFTPVIAPSGVIYVPGTRHLYAFNPDGSSPWAAPYNISSSRGSEIAVSPTGIIFEIDSNGTLHAINPLNTIASSIWTTNVGCIPSSLAVSSSGNIYCGTGENGTTALLYSIDSNGHIMWSLQTKSPVSIPPAVYGNGTIYAITSGGEILAISQFGIELWSISTVHMEETSPVIGPDGTIYVAGSNVAGQSVLVAISQAGTINWSEFCFKEGTPRFAFLSGL